MGRGRERKGTPKLCDVKEHRFSGSRWRVFDIGMGEEFPLLRFAADVGRFLSRREARGIKRDHEAEGWEGRKEDTTRRREPLAATLSTLQLRCRAPGDSQTVPSLFSLPLSSWPPRRVHGGWPRVSRVRVNPPPPLHGRFPRVIYYRLARAIAPRRERILKGQETRKREGRAVGRLNSNRRGVSQSRIARVPRIPGRLRSRMNPDPRCFLRVPRAWSDRSSILTSISNFNR